MNHRGIDYTVKVESDLWHWQFRIGDAVTTGKITTRLKGMASRKAQLRIDSELRTARDLTRTRSDELSTNGRSPDAS
jgi:hypothetical protein